MIERRVGELRGAVQGVGLRPFVARLAESLSLAGSVSNGGASVRIEVEGPADALEVFEQRLRREGPAAARLDEVRFRREAPAGLRGFVILESALEGPRALTIGADRRTCAECLAEVETGGARRHRYPFTSCTACGPRFTIVETLPFDRERTTMARFPLCAECRSEYEALGDRRAHAQTIACPRCGPHLCLVERDGRLISSGDEALRGAVAALERGAIVAVQGLGGFQLLCDARTTSVVQRLRDRKRRPDQPLAVMVEDLEAARALAEMSSAEARLLEEPSGPIVLLRKRGGELSDEVARGIGRIGVMLPTTPMHALLARDARFPLVCTSGNLHDDPIATDPDEARARLGEVADVFLCHDRPIAHRADDSVMAVVAGRPRVLRLGRGLGPRVLWLGGDGVPRLAVGGQYKNAPVLVTGAEAVLLPHVGDLESFATREAFAAAVASMERLLAASPRELVSDAHPDYAPTQWAEEQAEVRGVPLRRVFHHHAHIASVLAEHGLESALGFAWDGTGLAPGHDGSTPRIAGGESLFVDARGARWVAHLRPFALPGGDAASRDGRRSLAGALVECGLPIPEALSRFAALAGSPGLAPRTTSAGRLFDAVACLLGVRERSSYEGQAALELESIADTRERGVYPFALTGGELDWRPTLAALLGDRHDPPRASARFHRTLVAMMVAVTERERAERVALSGGCFANALLLEGVTEALEERGVSSVANERVPAGDGGLALGQAWVASRG